MKPEPLKDKGFRVLKVLNNKEYLIDKSDRNLYHKTSIKSAVEWLKKEYPKVSKNRGQDYLDVLRLIDKAFEDVMKK